MEVVIMKPKDRIAAQRKEQILGNQKLYQPQIDAINLSINMQQKSPAHYTVEPHEIKKGHIKLDTLKK